MDSKQDYLQKFTAIMEPRCASVPGEMKEKFGVAIPDYDPAAMLEKLLAIAGHYYDAEVERRTHPNRDNFGSGHIGAGVQSMLAGQYLNNAFYNALPFTEKRAENPFELTVLDAAEDAITGLLGHEYQILRFGGRSRGSAASVG